MWLQNQVPLPQWQNCQKGSYSSLLSSALSHKRKPRLFSTHETEFRENAMGGHPLRLTPPSSSPLRPRVRHFAEACALEAVYACALETVYACVVRGRGGGRGDLCCYAGTGVRQLGCNSPRRRGTKDTSYCRMEVRHSTTTTTTTTTITMT
jgi:hypothetical protein